MSHYVAFRGYDAKAATPYNKKKVRVGEGAGPDAFAIAKNDEKTTVKVWVNGVEHKELFEKPETALKLYEKIEQIAEGIV